MKIRNKKVLGEIAVRAYKANWKRNLFTVFSIVITTFMITTILIIGMSYQKTISIRNARMNGMSYDISLTEPEKRQVEQVRAMSGVAEAGLSVRCAVCEGYNSRVLDEVQLYWLDQAAWEKQCVPALEYYEGDYPKNDNEIMLSVNALRAMGVTNPQIGMKLPLTWYGLAGGMAEESTENEFTLCGYFKDYAGWERGFVSKVFYQHTGAKQTDFMQGVLMISMRNPIFSAGDIESLREVLSVSRDIICYGQLKTIGMTSVQLKSVIDRQVIWNCAAGIPIGLLSGLFVAKGIVPLILSTVNPILEIEQVIMAEPWICVTAVLFSFLTYWFGSRKPVRLVERCSAIEAVRYTDVTNRKMKKSGSVSLVSMAWSNVFRSIRQAIIILFSFVISTAMVWIILAVLQQNNAEKIVNTIYSYDIRFKNDTMLDDNIKNLITEQKITEVGKVSGVMKIGKVQSTDAVVPYQGDLFGGYYRNLYQSRYMPGENYEDDMDFYKKHPEDSLFTSRIIGIDSVRFEKLNEKLGSTLDRVDFERGKTAVVISSLGLETGDIEGKELIFWIPDNSQKEEMQKIEIAAVGQSKDLPAYFSRGYSPEIIVSQSYLAQITDNLVTELIEVSYKTPLSDKTEK